MKILNQFIIQSLLLLCIKKTWLYEDILLVDSTITDILLNKCAFPTTAKPLYTHFLIAILMITYWS